MSTLRVYGRIEELVIDDYPLFGIVFEQCFTIVCALYTVLIRAAQHKLTNELLP